MSRYFVENHHTSHTGAGFAIEGLRGTWSGLIPPGAEEVHLRRGRPASYTLGGRNFALPVSLGEKEMEEVFLALCDGSVYAHRETLRHGYLALRGGVRVGVAGRYVTEAGMITGVTDISGLCVRLPHRCPGLADGVLEEWERLCTGDAGAPCTVGATMRAISGDDQMAYDSGDCATWQDGMWHGSARQDSVRHGGGRQDDTWHGSAQQDSVRHGGRQNTASTARERAGTGAQSHTDGVQTYGGTPGGILVAGAPGAGKTTLLRELSLRLSERRRVVAVDTRGELCLPGAGRFLTALSDCPPGEGMEIAVRTLSPEVIVTDEIGREEVKAMLDCLRCGVPLFASAHGENLDDLRARAGLREVIGLGVFSLVAFVAHGREGTHIRTEVL